MTYTVLSTSGYQGDGWHYEKEFSSKSKAETFAATIRKPEPTSDQYNVKIKVSRKPARMTGLGEYTFPDGTVVTETHEAYLAAQS